MTPKPEIARLHYLTQDGVAGSSHADLAGAACAAGVRWVQLRTKGQERAEWLEIAGQVLAVCRRHGATLIVNDSVDVAAEVGADGVHLGRLDGDPALARRQLGADRIVGGTANTAADVRALRAAGVDYIGLGPYCHTDTKANLSPLLGLDGIESVRREAGGEIPLVAIGGITPADLADLARTGVHGVAVSSAINGAEDIQQAAAAFLAEMKGTFDGSLADRR